MKVTEKPAPRYTPDEVHRELVDLAKHLHELTDNIVCAYTNSDRLFAADAFADALKEVQGLRICLEDLAAGLVPAAAEGGAS